MVDISGAVIRSCCALQGQRERRSLGHRQWPVKQPAWLLIAGAGFDDIVGLERQVASVARVCVHVCRQTDHDDDVGLRSAFTARQAPLHDVGGGVDVRARRILMRQDGLDHAVNVAHPVVRDGALVALKIGIERRHNEHAVNALSKPMQHFAVRADRIGIVGDLSCGEFRHWRSSPHQMHCWQVA